MFLAYALIAVTFYGTIDRSFLASSFISTYLCYLRVWKDDETRERNFFENLRRGHQELRLSALHTSTSEVSSVLEEAHTVHELEIWKARQYNQADAFFQVNSFEGDARVLHDYLEASHIKYHKEQFLAFALFFFKNIVLTEVKSR